MHMFDRRLRSRPLGSLPHARASNCRDDLTIDTSEISDSLVRSGAPASQLFVPYTSRKLTARPPRWRSSEHSQVPRPS
eukprot:13144478-Alexandrium_andersonii.AAC.1